MEIVEIFWESLGTLTLNKLRTGLAILGIVIGIGSVIALISLGQASQQAVADQIQSLGANLLTVSPSAQTTNGVRGAAGGGTTLTLDDAQAIKTSPQVTTISNVSPEVSSRAQVTAGRNNSNIQIIGVTNAYQEVHKINIDSGSFITDQDNLQMKKVIVIGPQVASDLFTTPDPIGQSIRINGISFTIVGVTQSRGGTGFQNQDDIGYIPLQTAQKEVFGQNYLSTISLEAKSPQVMTQAQNEVGYLLLARHHLQDPSQADFSILSSRIF